MKSLFVPLALEDILSTLLRRMKWNELARIIEWIWLHVSLPTPSILFFKCKKNHGQDIMTLKMAKPRCGRIWQGKA